MSDFVGNLLLTSIICSLLVLIVLAVSPRFNKYTVKWRYVVFILLAIKLLLPMQLYPADNAIVIPMAGESELLPSEVTSDKFNVNNSPNSVKENEVGQNVVNQSTNTDEASFEKIESATIANVIYTVLFTIWLVGFVGFSCFYVFIYFYHRQNLDRWSSNITDENILNILEEEKASLGITKNIILKSCKKINTPMTFGFRHLSIIFPNSEYSYESIRHIFRHELTHQKRHDIYVKVLLIATKCLHWFNPVVPMMVNRAYDDMEILCDEMVVANMEKAQRIEYNETILSIAKSKAEEVAGKNILFAFYFVEKETNLKERVKNVMVMRKRKQGYQIVALAMAIIAGSCLISCGKNTEKGTSVEAKKVFEKIQEEGSYHNSMLLTAVTLHNTYDEDVKEENRYYWRSIGIALSAANRNESSFEDYDMALVNDTDKGQAYYVVEPKLVEAIGQVFVGSILEPNSIPLDVPEFAYQETGTTYPYVIEYKEDEKKYYAAYGELGSVYFVDCEYKINDNDTMTITGKYTRAENNSDEYLIANYEITVAYNPANEIYGFRIVDVKEV